MVTDCRDLALASYGRKLFTYKRVEVPFPRLEGPSRPPGSQRRFSGSVLDFPDPSYLGFLGSKVVNDLVTCCKAKECLSFLIHRL